MNLVKTIDQYDANNIFFCEPIKNNVMCDGNFIRVIYSTNDLVLNGIYLLITLNDIIIDKYYNKYRCTFNTSKNIDLIENIRIIEEGILQKYLIPNKIPQLKIYDQLKNGNIKLFTEIISKPECSVILKISGIWETINNYGVTYKFIIPSIIIK
jgi:hypothetical protein